jgi:hypothetical protein
MHVAGVSMQVNKMTTEIMLMTGTKSTLAPAMAQLQLRKEY